MLRKNYIKDEKIIETKNKYYKEFKKIEENLKNEMIKLNFLKQ